MAEKGGFKHFMLKEIYEQPRAVRDTVRGRVSLDTGKVYLDEMDISEEDFTQCDIDQDRRLRNSLARRNRRKVHDRRIARVSRSKLITLRNFVTEIRFCRNRSAAS